MNRQHWGFVPVAFALAIGARATCGCGSVDASADADAGTLEGGPADASAPPRYEAGSYDGAPQPTSEGWIAWNDFDPRCGFFTRVADKPLPALTWEPCGALAGAQENGCRQIHFEWGHPRVSAAEYISPSTTALRHNDGSIALITSREEGGDVVDTIVDVDGPVLQAIREGSPECQLYINQSFGNHFVYGVWPPNGTGGIAPVAGGAIGGRLDERPRVLVRFSDNSEHDYVAGDAGMVLLPNLELYSWSDGSLIASLRKPGDEGLYTGEFSAVGDTFVWTTGSSLVSRQSIWSPSLGAQSLLSAGDDPSHGYADLATDGVQMVWEEGNRTDISSFYPSVAIMTSPYATTTASLAPRRLRSDITGNGFGTTEWVIGCGYAARSSIFESTPGDYKNTTLVVRLSDGYAWRLPDPQNAPFGWRKPLAITCDEIFALVDEKPAPGTRNFNVVRLRLDALGPGIPPP